MIGRKSELGGGRAQINDVRALGEHGSIFEQGDRFAIEGYFLQKDGRGKRGVFRVIGDHFKKPLVSREIKFAVLVLD